MFNILLFITFFLCSCQTTFKVKVENGTFDFPDLQVEKEEMELYDFAFTNDNDKICLSKENQQKFLKNINNIKIAYYKTFEKYKLAVDNYNELKKIAYENNE